MNGNQWIDLSSDDDIFFLKGFLLLGLNTYTGALLANSYYNYSTGEEVQYIPTTGDFYVNGYAFTSGDNVTIHNLEFAGSSILQVNNQLTVNGEFTVDSGTSEIYGGSVTVPGNFYMTGSGTLVANTNFNVGGQATINEGTLELLGQMIVGGNVLDVEQEGALWLNNGTVVANVDNVGTIMGTGTIAGNVNNNGVVMPGDAPGTLAVKGSYTQGPSGTLGIGVAGIDGSQYSRVLVGGNASVNGTLSVFSLNNFRPVDGNSFEVLRTNGSRSGEFARVNDFLNYNPNLQQIDIYAPNGVALLYVAATTPPPRPTPTPPTSSPAPSPTPNPRPPIIDVVPKPLPPVEPNEPLPPSFVFPVLDPTAEQLTAMYEIGFSEANTLRFNLDERFDAIQSGSTGFVSNLPPAPPPVTVTTTGKEIAPKQPVLPPSPPEYRWGVWANGWGDWVSVSNDGSAKGYDFTTGGFIIGVDYRITDHFAVGVMGSYAHTNTNLQPSGEIDVNHGGGGVYLTYFCNGFYVDAATYGGYNSYSTSRQGLLGMANSSTSGGEFSTWTGAGYNFHFGDFAVGPMAALQYTLVHLNGFNETGSLLPLHIQSDQQGSLRTDLGGRASYTCHLGSVLVIPTLTVAWEHEYFYSDLPITVNSVDFPGQSATFFGPAEGHDSAIINAGAAFQFTPRLSTYLGYQGQLGRDHYNSNAITGGFSLSF